MFERERDIVLAEDTWRHARHETLHDELVETLWGSAHPYGRRVNSPEIAQATRKEACAFIAEHSVPNRAILVVTGNFRTDKAISAVRAAFGKVTRSSTAARTPLEPAELTGGTSSHVAARQVLRAMLEDRVRVVREGLGASYGVSVDYLGGIGGGALLVTGDLELDRSGKALVALVGELAAVRTRAGTLAVAGRTAEIIEQGVVAR